MRRVATIESIGSSTRIEGARLSDNDVEKLLANIQIGSFTTRDEQEVAGYASVMETIFSAYDAIPPTENHIRQLHRDLLVHSTKDQRHRGSYKTLANHVEAFGPDGDSLGIVFETASPFDTPRRMTELVEWLIEREEERDLHPLLPLRFSSLSSWRFIHFRMATAGSLALLRRCSFCGRVTSMCPTAHWRASSSRTSEGYYLALRRTKAR